MATATLSLREKLAKRGVTVAPVAEKEPTPTMTEMEIPEELRDKFIVLCDLGFVSQNLERILDKQRKPAFALDLLKIWVKKMWASRSVPDNFRVKYHRDGLITDCCANFLVKFRKEGLGTKIRKDIPQGMTVEEWAMKTLTSGVVGLTSANAKKFVQEEFVIEETMTIELSSLDACAEGTPQKTLVDKLVEYLGARPKGKANDVKLPPVTDEENAIAVHTIQTVTLKTGLSARIFTYCETEEQLLKLLQWIAVTQQISDFIVGEGDEQAVRQQRLGDTILKYLPVDVKKSK